MPSPLRKLSTPRELSRHAEDFIDDGLIRSLVSQGTSDPQQARDIIAKALQKEALTVEETASLLRVTPEIKQEIFEAARTLKQKVYGNRIVLFAPLYVGNYCVNDCTYCGFRRSNPNAIRRTLSPSDLQAQVKALEESGHKRLILVFGEHRMYDADFIVRSIESVYEVHSGPGEIRRVNVNAAPLDTEGFKAIKQARIGTYQIFMETYDHQVYAKAHPAGTPKGDYLWRLDAMNRAFEAGVDDVGIGALFGMSDWRFDVLGLVTHARYLQEKQGCGPHTISFPRLRPATGVTLPLNHLVSDEDFKHLVAVLRLAVPYTGMILTAREPAALRREIMSFGVSQIDAGSRIEIGGYTESGDAQNMEREQFELGDVRSLDEVMRELLNDGYVPSFCTACYRRGRTGEHFMEFAIPGFIQRFCTPNALTTLMEYLVDYGSEQTRQAGIEQIQRELAALPEDTLKQKLRHRLNQIEHHGAHDLYF